MAGWVLAISARSSRWLHENLMGWKERLWRLMYFTDEVDGETRVLRAGRDHHVVQIGDRSARVFTEPCLGEIDFVIEPRSAKSWLPPHDKEVFTPDDQRRVVEKLTRFMERNRYHYRIE